MRRVAPALMYLGVCVAIGAFSKLHASYAPQPYDFTSSSRFVWACGFAGLLSLSAYGAGLPDASRGRRQLLGAAVAASVGAGLALSAVQLVVGDALLPRFVVLATSMLMVPWFCFCGTLANDGRDRQEERDRVVVVGWSGELDAELATRAERNAQIVGVLSPDEAADPASPRRLIEYCQERSASVVVLDRAAQMNAHVVEQVALLHEEGARVRTMSLFHEEWLGKIPVVELERVALLFDIGEIHRARYTRLKRIVDTMAALVGTLFLLVVIPVVFAGNLFGNRGPLFYAQPRIGKGGRRFTIVKFRSMRPTASSEWTALNDARITPFGRWLRRTHLDELPQVVNILKGDLSLVGPRPEQPQYVEELADKLPFYQLRHLVQPGLTGWAQVKSGYAADESDALEKLQYEFFYMRHQSLQLDLRIIVRTIRAVLQGFGR